MSGGQILAFSAHGPRQQEYTRLAATPLTTRPGGADQNGHPAKVKARGAAGKRKD